MKVPFLDLKQHHEPYREGIHELLDALIDESAFVRSDLVHSFEEDLAVYCGVEHAVGVGSGTDALWLTLLAMDIGPGDEVITSPMTFVATVEAIMRTGAKPVFADIDPTTYNLDPEQVLKVITQKTKAIVPVHLFGRLAEMNSFQKIAGQHGLSLVEDAAQAHGAAFRDQRAGSMGMAGCFSFYPGKNLGAMGEGGAVVTKDSALAERIRTIANHGQVEKYRHQSIGWNSRLDGIQAGILQMKLRDLDRNNALRRKHASRYHAGLQGVEGLLLPEPSEHLSHVHHLYVVRVRDRDLFIQEMMEAGVACGIHYPRPIHLQAGYKELEYEKGSFPVSEAYAHKFVSLPMFPELSESQIDYVIEVVRKILAQRVAA